MARKARRSVSLVINPASGHVGPKAADEARVLLEELGIVADLHAPEPENLTGALKAAVAARPDVLMVLAGDGTARLAAELCGPNGPLLAPLPGGTMNMLPKALYGVADWRVALADALKSGVERPVGGGEIGGHTFYCAAMIGAMALFQPAREAARFGHVGEAMAKARQAYGRAFAGRVRFELDEREAHKAQSLSLLCPLISKAMDNDATALEAAAIDPANAAEAMRISARVVLSRVVGDWRDDPAVHLGYARHGRVWARHDLPALLDGESVSLGRNARFAFREKAFRALASAPQAQTEEKV